MAKPISVACGLAKPQHGDRAGLAVRIARRVPNQSQKAVAKHPTPTAGSVHRASSHSLLSPPTKLERSLEEITSGQGIYNFCITSSRWATLARVVATSGCPSPSTATIAFSTTQ